MEFTTALALIGLISLLTIGFEIMYIYATRGFGFGFSANRAEIERSDFANRIQKVYRNQVESTAYIVPILIAGALAGLDGSGVELAAALIVIGRAAFAILYYTGISFVRVPAFALGSFPSLYLAYLLLTTSAM